MVEHHRDSGSHTDLRNHSFETTEFRQAKGQHSDVLEAVQALALTVNGDYGKSVVATPKYGDVEIRKHWEFAALVIPQSHGQLIFEIQPHEVKVYEPRVESNDGSESIAPSRRASAFTEQHKSALLKLIDEIKPFAEQHLKVEKMGFVALSKLTGLPVEQIVALGSPQVARRAERLVSLLEERKVNKALEYYRKKVRPEVLALRDGVARTDPSGKSHESLHQSITQLDRTHADLENNPARERMIVRFIRRTDSLMKHLRHIKDTTQVDRAKLVPALSVPA